MIPRVRRNELDEIRTEVRRAAESNWSLWQRFKIFFHSSFDVSLDFAFTMLGLSALTIGVLTFVCFQNRSQFVINPVPADETALWISIVSALTGMLAFLCFAGGPSKKLHQICLRYPHSDESAGQYIFVRTLIASAVLIVSNAVVFAIFSVKFDDVEFQPLSALSFAVLQSAFQLSFVLILARRWVPPVKDCKFWYLGLLLMLPAIFGPIIPYAENVGAVQEDAGLMAVHQFTQLYMTPHAWLANIWCCYDQMNPVAVFFFVVTIAYCLLKGAKSFKELLYMSPSDSLDGDFLFLFQREAEGADLEALIETREELETTSMAQSVLDRVDEFEKEAASSGPKASLIRLFHKIYHSPNFVDRPRCFYWGFAITISVALLFPIAAAASFITACFSSSTEPDCQQVARFVSVGILLLPLMLSLSEVAKADRAALYPISNWSLKCRVLRRVGQFMVWVLPFWLAVNFVFCCFYEIEPWDKIRLVAEPLSVGLSVILIVTAVTAANFKPSTAINLALSASCCGVAILFVLGAMFTLLATEFVATDVELWFGKSAESVLRILGLKSILLLLFAAMSSAILIVIIDYCSFDILSRSGFANDLSSKRCNQELELARR